MCHTWEELLDWEPAEDPDVDGRDVEHALDGSEERERRVTPP